LIIETGLGGFLEGRASFHDLRAWMFDR